MYRGLGQYGDADVDTSAVSGDEMLTLLGVAVVIAGFALRFNPLLVVVASALVTGLAAGMAPEEVEALVTFPIETALAGIERLEYTRSLSRNGFSQVVAVFSDSSITGFRAGTAGAGTARPAGT